MKVHLTIVGSKALVSLAAPSLLMWHNELDEAKQLNRNHGTDSMARNVLLIHLRRGMEI